MEYAGAANDSSDTTTTSADFWCVARDDPYAGIKLFNFALTVLIAAFGLLSNTLVILVNKRIRNPNSADVYIGLLAVTDNLLIISICLFSYRYVYRILFPETLNMVTTFMTVLVGILLKTFSHCLNTYTIVLLNIDRYIKVKFVSRANLLCTPRRAVISFLSAVIGSAIFTVPRIIEYVPFFTDHENNVAHCVGHFQAKNGIGINAAYKLGYGVVTHVMVMYVIPLIILIATNITLISVVRKRRAWLNGLRKYKESTPSGEREGLSNRELSTIVTLLAVTVVFMVCQIPDMVIQAIWNLAPQHGPTANIFTYQILTINSSVNFIIYAVSSSIFRRRLLQTFGCTKKDMQSSGTGSYR